MKNFQRSMLGLVISCLQFTAFAEEQTIELEEVVVTSTKRENSLMDVAASVSAFTPEQLEERKIEGVLDLNVNVPSINSGVYNGQVFTTIRGVGFIQAQGVADPSVAQHVDGIYLSRTSSLRGAYFDLESVEVLRGPQGTLGLWKK